MKKAACHSERSGSKEWLVQFAPQRSRTGQMPHFSGNWTAVSWRHWVFKEIKAPHIRRSPPMTKDAFAAGEDASAAFAITSHYTKNLHLKTDFILAQITCKSL